MKKLKLKKLTMLKLALKRQTLQKLTLVLIALMVSTAINAQDIEKTDQFTPGYINGTYMNKFKTIDGVLYAVGYEGTKDWVLVRYPAGNRNIEYTVHPNCRRIARGAFQGAAYLKSIYLPATVSYIGEDAFEGCTALQGIYFDESSTSSAKALTAKGGDEPHEVARYDLTGRPCSPADKGVQIIVFSDYTTKTVVN